jgi:hypothetical protein
MPQITVAQKKEAIALFKHIALRTKTRGTTCMECGARFDVGLDIKLLVNRVETHCICPECKTKLEYLETRTRHFFDNDLFSVHTIYKGMQSLRYFEITRTSVYGDPSEYNFIEVVRVFITTQGKYALLAKLNAQSYYSHTYFSSSSQLEIRPLDDKYSIKCETWSGSKLIPEIYRNGFSGDLKKYYEARLFITLLSNNIMETFWKTNQFEMFDRFYNDQKRLDKVWPAIKICNRHNYVISDWYIWLDYIQFLIYFKKDITNPFYACPKKLKQVHDLWMNRKKKIDIIHDREARLKKLEQQEAKFKVQKSKYLDMEFTDGTIIVKPLQSVNEYYEMGVFMHHCIYNNEYFAKNNTLILTANVNDVPMETVEIDLKDRTVIQSRGKLNENTPYHNRIIELVNNNIKLKSNDTKSRTRKARQLA